MKALNKYIKESILDIDTGISIAGEDATKCLAGMHAVGSREMSSIPGLKDLKILVIPEGVRAIDDGALKNLIRRGGANKIETLVLPSTLVRIGTEAFMNLRRLKQVYWTKADRNALIYPYAFAGCDGLESITVPEGVSAISEGAFEDCSSLTDISFPNTLVTMGNGIFNRCNKLKHVDLSRTHIRLVPDYLFDWCINLEEVVLPKSCLSIRTGAFRGCGNLRKLKGGDIEVIWETAFYKCSSLIDIDITSPKILFGSVSRSGRGQFENCMSLKEFKPIIVDTLRNRAFCGCIELESISWDGHGGIENLALDNCRKLKEIHVPKRTDPNKIERLIEASGSTTLGDYKVTCSI